ncbi:MAG TPA: bacillithiol biosynthesis BshC [Gemmatimonadaceae bacterium]
MTPAVRIETERLGGSALSQLAQAGEAPSEWYPPRPSSPEEWRERIEAVRSTATRDWQQRLSEAFGPSSSSVAARRLSRVASENGIVVTTGQQAGLFGGPVYTWSKAMSALALADAIETATGIPTAAVFWAATDDSDLAEAAWTILAGRDGPERIALDVVAAEGTRMSDVPLPDMTGLLARLEAASGSVADPRPLEVTREAWRRPRTIGGAYVTMLRGLLEPMGVTVLDAAHEAVSHAAHSSLLRALHERERVAAALAERGRALRAAGHQPQVSEVGELTLVFQRRDGRRSRVSRGHAAVVAAGAASGSLSPNVLLRPVVERALLPTVAYVAGPAELAYFAQVSAVAAALSMELPLAVPRWSTTLVEPNVAEILDRHGLSAAEFADPHAVESRLARGAWPGEVAAELARLRRDLSNGMATVRHTLAGKDGLVPLTAVDGAARGMEWRIGRLERRITAAVKARDSALMRDLRVARGALYPDGMRQERAVNLLPILARQGLGLLGRMLAEAGSHARGLAGMASAAGAAP